MESFEFLKMELFDSKDLLKLVIRFALHFIATLIICNIYHREKKRKTNNQRFSKYTFTLLLLSTMVFLMCYLLENINIEMGFAIGLFAVFGILRYRTSQIPIQEMTYMFIIIGIAVINALANKKISWAELVFANGVIIIITYILENKVLNKDQVKNVRYEKIELIKPDKRQELIQDLQDRTGLKINNVEISAINLLQDTAEIRIYYDNEEK